MIIVSFNAQLKILDPEVLKVMTKLQHIMETHYCNSSTFENQKAISYYNISESICQIFHLSYINFRIQKFFITPRQI